MEPLLACLALMVLATAAFAAPEFIVDIDFNDEVVCRPEPITQAQVRELVQNLHDGGVETLLLRAGYLGLLPYHTDLSYPLAFDEEHARSYPGKRGWREEDLAGYIRTAKQRMERYQKVLTDFNPPELVIQAGHDLGMKVIIWIDIFDDGYPGFRSKFIEENPHCQWTARDGKTYFQGLISYAWPEARAFRVDQAKELLALGADGIHCSTSAHCRHLQNVREDDFYGFEQPVVDEYQRRFGVDIRTADDFDRDAWHTIKGEFMNQLYRDLAELCHASGKELWIGLQLGEHTHMAADSYFSDHVVARYRNLWQPLVDEDIADALIIGDYEILTQPGNVYWKAKGIQEEAAGDLFSWTARRYLDYCRGKTRVFLFGEWLGFGTRGVDERLAFFANVIREHGFDGIDVHEAWNFECRPNRWILLNRMKERLAGKKIPPLPE